MTTQFFRNNLIDNVNRLGNPVLDDLEKYFQATDLTDDANKLFADRLLNEFDCKTWKNFKNGSERLRYLKEELNIIDADDNTVKNITAGINRIFGQVCGFGKNSIEYQRELLLKLVGMEAPEEIPEDLKAILNEES
jgi:hypothetical protein